MRKTPLLIAATLTCIAALAACSSSSPEPVTSSAGASAAASVAASSAPAVESTIPADVLDGALSALCSGPAAKGGSEGVYDATVRTCTTPDGVVRESADFITALANQAARVQLIGSAYTEITGSDFPDCPTLAELQDTTATPPAISDTCMTQGLTAYTDYLLAK